MGDLSSPTHLLLLFLIFAAPIGLAAWVVMRSRRQGIPLSKAVVFGVSVPVLSAVAVILATIFWLAYSGYSSTKSYYVTIAELHGMGDKAYHSNLRVEGFVEPGTIEQNGTHVDFVLNEFESHSAKAAQGRLLKVSYKGSEPPPDTFKDNSQALAEGTYGRDGVFYATTLQAKCASKYAPAQPGATPAPASGKPSTASAAPPASSTQTAGN